MADQAFNSIRQVEEVVMVQVKQIQEMGAYVKLASLSLSNVATDQAAARAEPDHLLSTSSSTTTSRA